MHRGWKSRVAVMVLAASALAADGPSVVDVTQKVASLVKGNRLTLQVNKETLGAAAPAGDPAKLRITYSYTNRVRTRAWAEGYTVDISAPAPQALNVTKAEYGAFDDPVDVTSRIAEAVRDNSLPGLAVNDDTMGIDPNPGTIKQVIVRYAVGGVDGQQKMIAVDQDDELKIAAPEGGKKLTILEATYGAPVPYFDVTDILADKMQGNQLKITPDAATFGDPAPKKRKQLRITYIENGQTKTLLADEGKPAEIASSASAPIIIQNAIYGVLPK